MIRGIRFIIQFSLNRSNKNLSDTFSWSWYRRLNLVKKRSRIRLWYLVRKYLYFIWYQIIYCIIWYKLSIVLIWPYLIFSTLTGEQFPLIFIIFSFLTTHNKVSVMFEKYLSLLQFWFKAHHLKLYFLEFIRHSQFGVRNCRPWICYCDHA